MEAVSQAAAAGPAGALWVMRAGRRGRRRPWGRSTEVRLPESGQEARAVPWVTSRESGGR